MRFIIQVLEVQITKHMQRSQARIFPVSFEQISLKFNKREILNFKLYNFVFQIINYYENTRPNLL